MMNMLNLECGMRNVEKMIEAFLVFWRRILFVPPSAFCLPIFIGLLLLFSYGNLGAADQTNENGGLLKASLDREAGEVGSIMWLTLEYRLPEGGSLPKKPEIKGLEDFSILEQLIEAEQINIKFLVDHLESWHSEPIGLTYLDLNGQRQVLTAEPVSVQVVSNLGEKPGEAELRPIRDIIQTKLLWWRYKLWVAAIIAIVLLGIGIFWWRKKRRIRTIIPELVDPPHVRARKEIEQLETQMYFEKGRVKKYYFLFSEIIRRYLESIRNFPAAEFTTEEIAQNIKTEQDRILLPLLQRADLVKFADSVPTPARKEEDIKTVLAYIQETSHSMESVQEIENRPEVRS